MCGVGGAVCGCSLLYLFAVGSGSVGREDYIVFYIVGVVIDYYYSGPKKSVVSPHRIRWQLW